MNKLRNADGESLVAAARQARAQAYAPYSHFLVGAAVRATDGRIFAGVNVEDPSFGLTVCAERSAIAAAATAGVRPGHIEAVAVAAIAERITPCGACRQVLTHWCPADAPVWCASLQTHACHQYDVAGLLPHAFGLENS